MGWKSQPELISVMVLPLPYKFTLSERKEKVTSWRL